MMVARFRVATRASSDNTGIRRNVYVHVYDDREKMARAHAAARARNYDPADDVAGGMAMQTTHGFRWPSPDPGPVLVIRLWTGQITTRTIAHEAAHAAAAIFFMDHMRGWDSRARAVLIGDHEPLAYAVGDITSDIVANLYRLKLLPN